MSMLNGSTDVFWVPCTYGARRAPSGDRTDCGSYSSIDLHVGLHALNFIYGTRRVDLKIYPFVSSLAGNNAVSKISGSRVPII
jgi:hypothetical protein